MQIDSETSPAGSRHGDLGAEHATPGLAQQVVVVDAQFGSDGVEFVDEQLRRPEVGGRVGEVGAVTAADLVVVDDLASGLVGEFGDVADVVVRHPRPAVEHEQRMRAGSRVLRRGDLDPRFAVAERHRAGMNGHAAQHEP